jgi:hypothetical protein
MTAGNPRRIESLEVNEAEDGLVVFDPSRDMVHHLNSSAAVIFDLCDGTRDAATIAAVLRRAYELEQLPLAATRAGLEDLSRRQLIEWDPRPE